MIFSGINKTMKICSSTDKNSFLSPFLNSMYFINEFTNIKRKKNIIELKIDAAI